MRMLQIITIMNNNTYNYTPHLLTRISSQQSLSCITNNNKISKHTTIPKLVKVEPDLRKREGQAPP